MSCAWSEKLDRYVDSEISASELPEIDAHLRACPECAAGALSRLQLKRMTQAAGRRYSPRPGFRLKIEQSLAAEKAPRWGWRWAPVFAAAAVALAMLIPAGLWLEHSRSEQALGELADLHVSALASANPVDVASSDRHTVKPWFQGKLPFSFNLPELQNTPFHLLGGRLAWFQQSPGAQLLFQVGKHEISVFIFEDRAGVSHPASGSSLRARLSFNSETWTEGGRWYFAVGDANASDIHALADLLRAAARS